MNINFDSMAVGSIFLIMTFTTIQLGIAPNLILIIMAAVCYLFQLDFRNKWVMWKEETDNENLLKLVGVGENICQFLSWVFGSLALAVICWKAGGFLLGLGILILIGFSYWYLWLRDMTLKQRIDEIKWFFANYNWNK